MASFLARALDLAPVEDNRFKDVIGGSTHAGAINAIADAGITLGCNEAGTRFCPVSRWRGRRWRLPGEGARVGRGRWPPVHRCPRRLGPPRSDQRYRRRRDHQGM